MAIVQLPTRTDLTNYTEEIELEGETFRLRFYFNDRDGYWFMDVADSTNAPVISGKKVVLGIPLLFRYRDLARPAGDMVVVDTSNKNSDAGVLDLGDRVPLLYVESADIAAL